MSGKNNKTEQSQLKILPEITEIFKDNGKDNGEYISIAYKNLSRYLPHL